MRLISLYPTLLSLSLLLQNEGEEGKAEYCVWNPFRSKLTAAILGGVDKIHIKPGSKVLYMGTASGTTVSHVADIVGPVSALVCENVAMKLQPSRLLSPCVCKECWTLPPPRLLIFFTISVHNSITASLLLPSPLHSITYSLEFSDFQITTAASLLHLHLQLRLFYHFATFAL